MTSPRVCIVAYMWVHPACFLNWLWHQSLFSSWLIFLWWFTLKRYLCYTLYIVKAKENSREFVWQKIMVDGEWCSEWGKKGKSQGIEGSANANDLWVWMRPHIGFCTIGKCDLLSFFLLIESLTAACKFHPLFFWNMELLHMRFHLFCFSILAPPFFSSFSLSFFFLRILLLLGRDSLGK
jgi:hypothetical protein